MDTKFDFKVEFVIVFANTNVKEDIVTPRKKIWFRKGMPSFKAMYAMGGIDNVKRDQVKTAGLTLFKDFLFKIISTAPRTAEPKANQNHMGQLYQKKLK